MEEAFALSFKGWNVPIYYGNGHIGFADFATARMIAGGYYFGAELSAEDQRRFAKENEMARTPKGRKAAINTQALKLGEALAFVSVASRDAGEGDWQQHCQFHTGYVAAFDGVISAAFPVEEELGCCPHTEQLQIAVAKCGASLAITLTEAGRLSIKGDKLRALVPTLALDTLPAITPDPQIAPLNDEMKKALACVGTLVSEGEDEMLKAAIMLDGGMAMSTNRTAALQYWHGNDFPPAVVVPKLFAVAVCKQNLALVGFGVGWRQNQEGGWQAISLTFYFENGAWIKTQCYADPYPSFSAFMDVQSFPGDTPPTLFEAVEAVAKFADGDAIWFGGGKVMSHPSEEVGAQHDVEALTGGKCFDPRLLKKVAPFAAKIDYITFDDRMLFFGDNVRGVVMARK